MPPGPGVMRAPRWPPGRNLSGVSLLSALTVLQGLGAVSQHPWFLHRWWKSVYTREINPPLQTPAVPGKAGDVRLALKPRRCGRRFFLFGKGVGQSTEPGRMARPQAAAGPSQRASRPGVQEFASDLATGLGQRGSASLFVYYGSVVPRCAGPVLRAPSPAETSGCKGKCLEDCH